MGLTIGVDIGGTKIAAGLVSESGRLLRSSAVATPADAGPVAVVDAAAKAVTELGGPVAAVGVGSAGVVDPVSGRIVSATEALPGWAGTPLRDELRERLGVPVAVDNDVHAHALGEAWLGAGAGCGSVLLIAVGTGIGASLIVDGRVRHGAHGVAGHAGHIPVPGADGRPCTCGGTGHVEAVASGPALLAEYRRRGGADVADLAGVSVRADGGEELAAAVLAEGATALGHAVGGLVNMIDPEVVLISGGVSRCGAAWWDPLRSVVGSHVLPPLAGVPVTAGRLGNDAALLGAARLALEAVA